MKTCFVCEKTMDVSAFYVDRSQEDARTRKCKECTRTYVESRRKKPRNWLRKTADRLAYDRAYRKAHPEKNREAERRKREREKKHPELKLKRQAREKLRWAVRAGKVLKLSCERCGDPAEAHHADYAKPLEVRWLCPAHHRELHRAEG